MLSKVGLKLELMLTSYPEEQLDSLEHVAERSVCYLQGILKGDFLIDDSGIFIKGLGGFPGVYSSYVYRTIGNNGILKLMRNNTDRVAEFSTCIAYYDGKINLFSGSTEGHISDETRGKNGFGFDPIFIPRNSNRTYAEMSTEEKNKISHRSKAADKFLEYLKKKKI